MGRRRRVGRSQLARGTFAFVARKVTVGEGKTAVTYLLDPDGSIYVVARGTRRRVRDPKVLARILKIIERQDAPKGAVPVHVPHAAEEAVDG